MSKTIRISPLFIKYFPVASLHELGLNFTFTTHSIWPSPIKIYLSLFQDGVPLYRGKAANFPLIKQGEVISVLEKDFLSLLPEHSAIEKKSLLGLVHLVPTALIPANLNDESLLQEQDYPLDICMDYCMGTDGYASYFKNGLQKMTVGYHGLWWNSPKARADAVTLFQGCKFHNQSNTETDVLLINVAVDWNWKTVANGSFFMTDSEGKKVSNHPFDVPAFSYRLIRCEKNLNLNSHTEEKYLNIVGACTNAQTLPFIISKNNQNQTFFIEHGMPPSAYLFGYKTSDRKKSAEFVSKWSPNVEQI